MNDIEKIQAILNKTSKRDENVVHYRPDEKCDAINNWKRETDADFDTTFVDSVYDQYLRWGKCSIKQVAALDKILLKFGIDVNRWV